MFQDISHSFEAQKIFYRYQIGELREVSLQFEVKFTSETRSSFVTLHALLTGGEDLRSGCGVNVLSS